MNVQEQTVEEIYGNEACQKVRSILGQDRQWGYRILKRGMDVVGSAAGLVVLSPVLLVTSLAIYLEDGGPVIFRQKRNGLYGKEFTMYKFRSMCKDAPRLRQKLSCYNELDGPAFKMKEDPRVTKVGKFIRRTSIDELPQLLNILKGEMSIVGPRPLPTYETEQLTAYQRQRLLCKPGLTCYWQISGRSDVDFEKWMEMDIHYVRHADLSKDIKLILQTMVTVLTGKGAY